MKMIESGIVDRKYVFKLLQKIFNARWITTANRILRLYLQTEDPSDDLVTLVNFIMKAYGPTIISVHLRPEVWNGPEHFWQYLKWAQESLPIDEFELIFPRFIWNGCFAHPENILFAGKPNLN